MSARLVGEVIPKVYSLCSLWAVNSVRHVFGGLRGGDARFRTEAHGLPYEVEQVELTLRDWISHQ